MVLKLWLKCGLKKVCVVVFSGWLGEVSICLICGGVVFLDDLLDEDVGMCCMVSGVGDVLLGVFDMICVVIVLVLCLKGLLVVLIVSFV